MEPALADFFRALRAAGDDSFFRPHPLTDAEAGVRTRYRGQDLYYVIVEEGRILGYGFLRGWDEGYDVPALGIVIRPALRGTGLGRMLMHVLHQAARRRGASRVRLRVFPENTAARRLYEDLGYTFETEEMGKRVGILELRRRE